MYGDWHNRGFWNPFSLCWSIYMVCCQCSLLLGMEKVEQDFVKLGLVTLGGAKYGNATDLNI